MSNWSAWMNSTTLRVFDLGIGADESSCSTPVFFFSFCRFFSCLPSKASFVWQCFLQYICKNDGWVSSHGLFFVCNLPRTHVCVWLSSQYSPLKRKKKRFAASEQYICWKRGATVHGSTKSSVGSSIVGIPSVFKSPGYNFDFGNEQLAYLFPEI